MPTIGQTRTTRKPAPPATGKCHWLPDAPNGKRQLDINGTAYEVEKVSGGYRLYRFADDRILRYRIDTTWNRGTVWACNCPDATKRPERRCSCKHVRALRAALAARPY